MKSHLGILGPQRSISSTPTVKSSFVAKHRAKVAVTVLLPTPPYNQILHLWKIYEKYYFSREDEDNVFDCVKVLCDEVNIRVRSSRAS